jgi:hypothetical protein
VAKAQPQKLLGILSVMPKMLLLQKALDTLQ